MRIEINKEESKPSVIPHRCPFNDSTCGYWEASGACTIPREYICKHIE